MPANTLKRPSPTAPVAMHQLIGLDYIPIIPIMSESVWKPVIWGFFFTQSGFGAAFFSAGDFYSFTTADGGWWREDTSNLSDKMCWRWRWFFHSFVFNLNSSVFLMKNESGVWTQLRTENFKSKFLVTLKTRVFFSKYSRWFRQTRRVFAIFHPKSPRGFWRFF